MAGGDTRRPFAGADSVETTPRFANAIKERGLAPVAVARGMDGNARGPWTRPKLWSGGLPPPTRDADEQLLRAAVSGPMGATSTTEMPLRNDLRRPFRRQLVLISHPDSRELGRLTLR